MSTPFDLTGRTALVTGANRGLGRAFAEALAEFGADVVLVGRHKDRNARAAQEIATSTGRRATVVTGDVAQRGEPRRIVAQALSEHDRIDILVNNAGVCYHRPALEVPDAEFDEVFDVNVTGLWSMSTAVASHMVQAGGGSIVNVGSISAMIVNRPQWQPAYNASKAAVHQLTRSLAAEWAPHGHAGQRDRAGLREHRDGTGRRAPVQGTLDRRLPHAALRDARGDRAQRGLPGQ